MVIVKSIDQIPALPKPIALTIGNFDGVHLGHQKLLKEMRKKVGPAGALVVLTFENHPTHILGGKAPAKPIYTLEEKLNLLAKEKVDLLILLTFTKEISLESSETFLKKIHAKLPFSFLILGKGAAFGKGRKGDESQVKELGKTLQFQAEYLEKETCNGREISSNWIRDELANNHQTMAENLLGRKL